VWCRRKRWTDPVRVDLERVLSVRSLELNIVNARLNSQHRVPARQSDRIVVVVVVVVPVVVGGGAVVGEGVHE
jgi:hypothetical protein